jgi:hypothetical protein
VILLAVVSNDGVGLPRSRARDARNGRCVRSGVATSTGRLSAPTHALRIARTRQQCRPKGASQARQERQEYWSWRACCATTSTEPTSRAVTTALEKAWPSTRRISRQGNAAHFRRSPPARIRSAVTTLATNLKMQNRNPSPPRAIEAGDFLSYCARRARRASTYKRVGDRGGSRFDNESCLPDLVKCRRWDGYLT